MKTRTIGVPKVLHRSGTSEISEDGKVRLSIATETPYLRYDWRADEEYYEVLDHSPGAINMTRLRAGAALLFNHRRDIHLGVLDQPQVENGKLYVEARVSEAPDVESYRIRMKEKILKDTSVGYEVDEEGEEAGELEGIPIYKFKWFPHEASMVTIAADINCGLGRDTADREERDGKKPDLKEIQISEKILVDENRRNENNSQERETRESNMTPEEKAAADEKERKQRERDEADAARERSEKIQEGVKTALERATEIREIAKRATVPEDKKGEFERALHTAIEKAVTDEKAVGDFQTYVFKNFWGKAEPVETPAGEGASDIKVVGQRNQPGGGERRLTAGERFVNTKGFKEFVEKGKGEFRANVGGSILAERGLGLLERSGFNSSDLGAVNVTISQEMISLGVQRLTIADLMAGGVMTTAGFIYPVENSFDPFVDAAQMVAERQLKPEWEPDITTARADAQVIAVMATVPKQFMADFGAFGSWLNSRGDYLLKIKLEQQLLYGDGLGPNLLGVMARAGIQTRAYGTVASETTPDALFRGNTDIETNAYFDPDGFAMHPYDFEQIRLLKDANGQYLGGGPFYAPYGNGTFLKYHTIWGLPCVVSKSVKQGKPIAGAWKMGAQWFLREGLQIETSTSHKDYFQRNLLAVLFEERMALAVYRPIAFLEHTGFPGRS